MFKKIYYFLILVFVDDFDTCYDNLSKSKGRDFEIFLMIAYSRAIMVEPEELQEYYDICLNLYKLYEILKSPNGEVITSPSKRKEWIERIDEEISWYFPHPSEVACAA